MCLLIVSEVLSIAIMAESMQAGAGTAAESYIMIHRQRYTGLGMDF